MRVTMAFMVAVLLSASGWAAAQEPKEKPQQPSTGRTERETGAATAADHELMAVKIAGNRNEIELAKLAQQKSQNEQVKQFAAKMIKAHELAGKKLDKFVGEARRTTTERSEAGHSGTVNWSAIHQQLADQCLASTKRELSAKEGPEFDKCYIGMQIGAHQRMIDMDHVFANHVSAEARTAVEECEKVATEHLREAKEIMQSLEGKPATRTANRE